VRAKKPLNKASNTPKLTFLKTLNSYKL